jgi:hypothetical protein
LAIGLEAAGIRRIAGVLDPGPPEGSDRWPRSPDLNRWHSILLAIVREIAGISRRTEPASRSFPSAVMETPLARRLSPTAPPGRRPPLPADRSALQSPTSPAAPAGPTRIGGEPSPDDGPRTRAIRQPPASARCRHRRPRPTGGGPSASTFNRRPAVPDTNYRHPSKPMAGGQYPHMTSWTHAVRQNNSTKNFNSNNQLLLQRKPQNSCIRVFTFLQNRYILLEGNGWRWVFDNSVEGKNRAIELASTIHARSWLPGLI